MLFSSYSFICIFLPLLILAYYVVPTRWKNTVLLLASLFFYGWGGFKYLLIMLFSIVINYFAGLFIGSMNGKGRRDLCRWVMIVSVVLNLCLLGYFKYTDFFIDIINHTTHANIPLKNIVLPIGISFYTFQEISYIIDIWRNKQEALKNPLELALYISLFPQLIAGPIVRYETIAPQISSRRIDYKLMNEGMYRFVLGLSKKILIANYVGEFATVVFSKGVEELNIITAWGGAIAYTLQIYFDFSGYSDMAIGLGWIFGFNFPENFNYPYIADSITEFWRRWHISLSTWFRDYVYIPLGGNRKGIARQLINILIVWTLTGLWHGASWNFVAWGLYYAVLLITEKLLVQTGIKINHCLKHMYTLIAVTVGWVIFQSATLEHALQYIKCMFTTSESISIVPQIYHMFCEYGIMIVMASLLSTPIARRISNYMCDNCRERVMNVLRSVVMVVLFILCFIRLVVSSYNPFIYFRF